MDEQRHETAFRGIDAIVRDLQMPPCDAVSESATLSPEIEERLWDYALGSLEPDEEHQIFRLLATSPIAEKTLARIRQAMIEAGVPGPIHALDTDTTPEFNATVLLTRIRSRFESMLSHLSEELASAAAVIVNWGDGLLGAVGATEVNILQKPAVVTLDGKTLEGDTVRPVSSTSRINIPPLSGLGAAVIWMASDRVDILVTACEPQVEGRVRLLRLVESSGELLEEDTGIEAYLRGTEPARLEDCPSGMLKIIAPDGRQLIVCWEKDP